MHRPPRVINSTLHNDLASTFSIVAYDPETRDLGVAVQSKYFAVGSVVPRAEANVGAIATQAWANVSYGPDGLALLRRGLTPSEVVAKLTEADVSRERRQLGIVDARGNVASFTGSQCIPWAASRQGENYTAQGNILIGREVVEAMGDAFEASKGELADKLIESLEAGQKAGGDARGMQAAAILVVREGAGPFGYGDRYVDLRVDDHAQPIEELKRLVVLTHVYHQITKSRESLERGNVEAAVESGERAVELAPNSDVAHLELAAAYYRSGDRKSSSAEFRRAVEINPKTLSYAERIPRFGFVRDDQEFHRLLGRRLRR